MQEEIRFAVCPELIAGCLLCEKMDDNEAIIILGARQYSAYSGYGFSLKFAGAYNDETPLYVFFSKVPYNCIRRAGTPFSDIEICAIDARDYRCSGTIVYIVLLIFNQLPLHNTTPRLLHVKL